MKKYEALGYSCNTQAAVTAISGKINLSVKPNSNCQHFPEGTIFSTIQRSRITAQAMLSSAIEGTYTVFCLCSGRCSSSKMNEVDFTDTRAASTIIRLTGGNIRRPQRLFMQIERVLRINDVAMIAEKVVEAAAQALVVEHANQRSELCDKYRSKSQKFNGTGYLENLKLRKLTLRLNPSMQARQSREV